MKSRGKNAFVLVISICCSLLLAEAMVRFAAPQQLVIMRSDIWQPDDGLGWRHRANVDTVVNTGEKTVRFFTDANGYRVNGNATETKEYEARILVLGDSFLEALQVENEFTIPEVIVQDFEKKYGKNVWKKY